MVHPHSLAPMERRPHGPGHSLALTEIGSGALVSMVARPLDVLQQLWMAWSSVWGRIVVPLDASGEVRRLKEDQGAPLGVALVP